MYKCGDCTHEVAFDAVQTEIDGEGCFYSCPACGSRNPLVNVAASMGGAPGDIWLAQPSLIGLGWKPGRH